MNIGAISEIGDTVAAIAVLVSLVYLAIQVRQNTEMMRTTAIQSLTESSQQLIFQLIGNSDSWVKLVNDEAPSSPEEEARMSLLIRAMLRGFESQCYQYHVGLLEEDEWRALRAAIVDLCGLPGVHKHWTTLAPYMSQRLKTVVEAGLAPPMT